MTDSIQFGSKRIEFRLDFAARKTLGITVTPEMEVVVRAPEGADLEKIRGLVRQKAPWILKQLSFFLAFQPRATDRKFVGGETHLYLGRQYRLQVELTAGEESVKLKGQFLEVRAQEKSRARQLVEAWYWRQAQLKFREFAAPLVERFKKYGVEPAEIVLRAMPTRWGSCTPKGKIILNPDLVRAPRGCIEYVILHELCHLVHHGHTQKFFDLQARELPTWEKWKARLEVLLA